MRVTHNETYLAARANVDRFLGQDEEIRLKFSWQAGKDAAELQAFRAGWMSPASAAGSDVGNWQRPRSQT